jgi:regulatory protein
LLAGRDHSRLELHRKLVARGFAAEAVDAVLDRLSAEGLLSESRLAESYVAERLAKGFGPLRVRDELRRKGLADDLIEPHLHDAPEQWLERLAAVHDKRFGPSRPTDMKERARRARFLEGRGFPAELVGRFLFRDH